ncbi:MAG: aldo/keto reductase [Phycisphaerales bacterium]|nr:aldo/keto reductase [Phycisphaerales bacterium]
MIYRRCGRSGLLLPAISLGAWETFGGYRGGEVARECLFRAFDLGITHFDFANNYGTPPGNAEVVCGKIIREMPRDELVISSKAGFLMWPGPYGEWGSRKNLITSCDHSLKRMGLDYFDIFYSHRPDPQTPLDETIGALDSLVKQGKALYAGISNYNGAQYADAVGVVRQHDWSPITIHQPYYNLLNRKLESDLLPLTERFGTGVIAFCPLASGLLTDKYLGDAIPDESRVARKWGKQWLAENLTAQRRQTLIELNEIARSRGQTLAQMALAWVLRLPGITSALIGASSAKQVEENVAALKNLTFTDEQLQRIEQLAPIG